MVDDYDVLSEGEVVGRILKSGPMAKPWFWEFSYGYHYDRSPAHGYEATREDAMAAFRKGWLLEQTRLLDGRKSCRVAVGTCVSLHAPRPDPYVRLSRIRLPPRVCAPAPRRRAA